MEPSPDRIFRQGCAIEALDALSPLRSLFARVTLLPRTPALRHRTYSKVFIRRWSASNDTVMYIPVCPLFQLHVKYWLSKSGRMILARIEHCSGIDRPDIHASEPRVKKIYRIFFEEPRRTVPVLQILRFYAPRHQPKRIPAA